MTSQWWAEPTAGEIVWCHFPDDIHPPAPDPVREGPLEGRSRAPGAQGCSSSRSMRVYRKAGGRLWGDGSQLILVLTFESADSPQEPHLQRALEIVRAHGGAYDEQALGREGAQREGAAGQCRDAFIRMPGTRRA